MKALYLLSFVITITFQSYAQINNPYVNYDLKKTKLLIKSTGMYIYSSNQGFVDVDSTMILACTYNKVPVSILYEEAYSDGKHLPGDKLIDQNNITAAKKILPKLKETDRLKLLLHLGYHFLYKAGEKKEDLQNTFQFFKQADQISESLGIPKWQRQSTILLGKYYVQTHNVAESKNIFSNIVTESRKLNNRKTLADALNNEGTYLPLFEADKEKVLSEAMLLYKSIGEKELEIEMQMKLLTVHFWTGKMELAEKELFNCFALQKKIGFKHLHYTTAPLAYIYTEKFNLNKALYYSIASIKTMEATNDLICGDNFYLRLGNTYDHMGHIDEAIEIYKKAFEIGQKNINSGSYYKGFILINECLSKNKRYKEALNYIIKTTELYPPKNELDNYLVLYTKATTYEKLGNMSAAEKYYIQMEKYADNLLSPKTAVNACFGYLSMSIFYVKKGNSVKAKLLADKVLSFNEKTKQNYQPQMLELALYKLDSLTGNYPSSIRHHLNYTRINDSLFNIGKNRQIEELKIQYETLKDKENIQTLELQTKLQETKIAKSKLLNNLSIGSIFLLLIIIILLYNQYLLKQKNHKKLEIKEKEINFQNTNLKHLLDENRLLLKEIHHRVKNNLQMVISLLNLQSSFVDNEIALTTIKNSQNRILAMSLIHQKLFMSENVSTINMPIYIRELVEYLKDSFDSKQHISFKLNIEEVELDVTQAVPLGLIINEAITNALKYAFPNNRDGIIAITLLSPTSNQYLLTIQDNGIGIRFNSNVENNNSFGINLIKWLCDDLKAHFSIENKNGTLLQLSFEKTILITNKTDQAHPKN
ncbi:histidine kinase dimerization/phosphoacceptor domain -containing protein [Flavobacterium sp. LC2016-01]|uniref:histidine kinase dimerization/phosphoacceptor domain -containing protein n=1 Tax=Flavobacterium sp. LC2016-01 TaxID=2675876 RepID=UPI0012BAABAB|nr:histidine kinase dimerization/phosphoacceptor domain -containing protein [Flavobacterium sp. LC2016-01]MTH17702.1 hypothetical protein [Flavobacterium sp. LC2016-01]